MGEFEAIFDLPQIPAGTAQMKGVNHYTGRFYKKKPLIEAEQIFRDELCTLVPRWKMQGPIQLTIELRYMTKDKKKRGKWKTTRPDADNAVKLLIDVMTDLGVWGDDSQIVDLRIRKRWSCFDYATVYIEAKEIVV